jgi:membrane associated rhomboid family serine protease/DNA-directed RNA polymerase subunit RPC12/RpoP
VSEAELFVVCKNCKSEVSMYVTECPYCGQRVRKRAPKLDRGEGAEPTPRRRRRPPSLTRLRSDEIPGIAPETRPYATGILIVAALATTISAVAGITAYDLGAILLQPDGDWWRIVAYAFVSTTPAAPFADVGALFATLVAIGIFGTMIERRFGSVAAVAIFVLGAAAGGALTVALDVYPALGANGAALALLAAWLVDDRLAERRGDDRENDLLGVAVIAGVLLLLPLANENLSWAAGLGGAAAGAVLGALVSPLRR